MPRTLSLDLSVEQRGELERVRDHHGVPHMREKAAALLKIVDGQTGWHVAQHGLLKRRDSDTIYRWVARYQAEGVTGVRVRAGRRRKPAFSPSVPRPSSDERGVPGAVVYPS